MITPVTTITQALAELASSTAQIVQQVDIHRADHIMPPLQQLADALQFLVANQGVAPLNQITEFRYVVTGVEPDPTALVIPFPSDLLNTNFNVHVDGGGLAAFVAFDCPVASYTTHQFVCKPSAHLTAGDVLLISVMSFTVPPFLLIPVLFHP